MSSQSSRSALEFPSHKPFLPEEVRPDGATLIPQHSTTRHFESDRAMPTQRYHVHSNGRGVGVAYIRRSNSAIRVSINTPRNRSNAARDSPSSEVDSHRETSCHAAHHRSSSVNVCTTPHPSTRAPHCEPPRTSPPSAPQTPPAPSSRMSLGGGETMDPWEEIHPYCSACGKKREHCDCGGEG